MMRNEMAIQPRLVMSKWMYRLFLLSLIVDIGGAFGIKYAASILIMIYILSNFGSVKISMNNIFFEVILFGVLPLFLLVRTAFCFATPLSDSLSELSFLITWIVFPLLLFVEKDEIVRSFTDIMVFGSLAACLLFILFIGLYSAGELSAVQRFGEFADSYRLGYFGQRPLQDYYAGFVPNVYFRWTMLLIPAAILLLGVSNLKFAVVFVAVISSFSTGTILFVLIGIAWFFIIPGHYPDRGRTRKSAVLWLSAFLLSIALLVSTAYNTLIGFVISKLIISSPSTELKLSHARSIVDAISGDVDNLLFGTGIGSSFFSEGTGQYEINVEVSHLNLIRQFGLLYALLFFCYVVWLASKLYKSDATGARLSVALLLLLAASGTNPLLLSPVFFLTLIIGKAYQLKYAESRRASEIIVA